MSETISLFNSNMIKLNSKTIKVLENFNLELKNNYIYLPACIKILDIVDNAIIHYLFGSATNNHFNLNLDFNVLNDNQNYQKFIKELQYDIKHNQHFLITNSKEHPNSGIQDLIDILDNELQEKSLSHNQKDKLFNKMMNNLDDCILSRFKDFYEHFEMNYHQ